MSSASKTARRTSRRGVKMSTPVGSIMAAMRSDDPAAVAKTRRGGPRVPVGLDKHDIIFERGQQARACADEDDTTDMPGLRPRKLP